MSLSIAIASFVTADIALIALLAFVMSRAARLTPQAAAVHASAPTHRLRVIPSARTDRARSDAPLPLAA